MATFEEHVEGLTKIDITSSSVPNQTELTTFLVNGVIDCVNKMIVLKPEELPKFSKTTNAPDSVVKQGKILSVLREHDSTSILRPCSPVHPSLRYESTDVNSLHYRSKYNPGYYEKDGLIITVPEASSGGNNVIVTQVSYDTDLVNSDEYNNGAVENFPLEYEYLIALYASSMVCNAKANDIHNNMPTNPVAPVAPDFSIETVTLPTLPIFSPPPLSITFGEISSAISREDFDKADKAMAFYDKKIAAYDKLYEQENSQYQLELEVFKSDLDKLTKNADRKTQIEATEYKSELERYAGEINLFQAELQEKITQYKWYVSQSMSFMQQYNTALGLATKPSKQKQEKEPKRGE